MNEITLTGTPDELGRTIGRSFREIIRQRLRPYPDAPEMRAKYERLASAMRDYLEYHFPHIVEEIRGIAEGAGLDFPSAFHLSTFNAVSPAARFCTSIGFARSDVGPLLGKTDDGALRPEEADPRSEHERIKSRLDSLVVVKAKPSIGHAFLCVTPAGSVWAECGVNERGLCLGSSSGQPPFPNQDGYGVPQHIACRLILQHCANVSEGVRFFKQHKLAGKGINITLVDRDGNAAGIEACSAYYHVRQPHNGVVFTTNHYNGAEMIRIAAQTLPAHFVSQQFQNSLNRFINLKTQLHGSSRQLTLDLMKRLISNHTPKGAICQHFDNNSARMFTSFGAVMVARERRMLFFAGKPCETTPLEYNLEFER